MLEVGLPVPEEFLMRPPPSGLHYWEGFWVLHQGRRWGGGMSPVPNALAYSEIVSYAVANHLEPSETATMIQLLDGIWRTDTADRVKASQPKAEPKARGREREEPAE